MDLRLLNAEPTEAERDAVDAFLGPALEVWAGDGDGHHMQNRSDRDAVLLEVGTNTPGDVTEYPEIDLRALDSDYVHKDGRRYPG